MRAKHSDFGCEIIELAIEDVETLTRAFEAIKRVCEELSDPDLDIVLDSNRVIH